MSTFLTRNRPINDWPKQTVWVIGASSGIGLALATYLASLGAKVIVSARREGLLAQFTASHSNAVAVTIDVTNHEQLQAVWETQVLPHSPTLICYCVGDYVPMHSNYLDAAICARHMAVNYLGCCILTELTLPYLKAVGGHLSIMGSVAAYRGLPKAIAYGPSKAALHQFSEILHQELLPLGVSVSLISPGFVDTALTRKNSFNMPALITPEHAAKEIVQGWEKGLYEIHFPKRFSLILKFAQLLPHSLFFWLSRRMLQDSQLAARPAGV